MTTSTNKKGQPARTDRPRPKHSTLHGGKNGRGHCTESAQDAHVLALAHALAYLLKRRAKVLAVIHTHGNRPLVVIEYGIVAWSLPSPCRTAIIGRGGKRTERWEAEIEGVRVGWEHDPARRTIIH